MCHKAIYGLVLWTAAIFCVPVCYTGTEVVQHHDFDVVIAGGSTAAFAAAIASARCGARTALIEPTDWVGGQLTAGGVTAVDEAWHTIVDPASKKPLLNVAQVARDPRNITPNFLGTLSGMKDCGKCWVSRYCFRPREYLRTQLLPLEQSVKNKLVVFRETVVKRVELNATGRRIEILECVRRKAKNPAVGGYSRLLSQDLADWYSAEPSATFEKRVLRFSSPEDKGAVFIEGTEWGEVLALAGLDYLQGIEYADGKTEGNDVCGQATVFGFVQEFNVAPQSQDVPTGDTRGLGYGKYADRPNAWEQIWTYRRIRGTAKPTPGDLSLQNWGYSVSHGHGGNDYPFGYLFKSRTETAKEIADWRGGINVATLAKAEQRAFGWHHWFRRRAPEEIDPDQITIAVDELGTTHGLSKVPYVRDTRRSIGLNGFVLKLAHLTGPAEQRTGTKFADRVAIGAYPVDIHPLEGCNYPDFVTEHRDTLPFYLPFRALTHDQLDNLLVAGKTMAQSFMANAATRVHPTEWSSGTAAGVAAAYMARTGKNSREMLELIKEVQPLIQKLTPIEWTFIDTPP